MVRGGFSGIPVPLAVPAGQGRCRLADNGIKGGDDFLFFFIQRTVRPIHDGRTGCQDEETAALAELGDECHVIFAEVIHGNGGDFIGDVGTEGNNDGFVSGGGKISCKGGEIVRISGNQRGGEQVNVFLKF